MYGEVLQQLRTEYADQDRADLNRLFQQGIAEFRLALLDEAFQKLYLPAASKGTIDNFLANVTKKWSTKQVKNIEEAKTFAFRIALQARADLGIKPTVTVLEFACGACNALDEHTYYMTPRQFGEDLASLRGETVGVGIEVQMDGHKLVISQVVMNSPAARAGLRGEEEIVRIDRLTADKLTVDGAHEKLKGKAGTTVELEVVGADSKPRTLTLIRQAINGSVTVSRMLGDPVDGIAYIHLAGFNENTLLEVDDALRNLEMQGMKVLILDLRGNAGGLFDAAVQVAERFLWEGAYIVSTRGKVRDVKRCLQRQSADRPARRSGRWRHRQRCGNPRRAPSRKTPPRTCPPRQGHRHADLRQGHRPAHGRAEVRPGGRHPHHLGEVLLAANNAYHGAASSRTSRSKTPTSNSAKP